MKEGCPTDEVVLIALGIEALLKLFLFSHFERSRETKQKSDCRKPDPQGNAQTNLIGERTNLKSS